MEFGNVHCTSQTVEVGVRSIYNQSLQTFMNHLDVKTKDKKKACAKIADISLRALYTIICAKTTVIGQMTGSSSKNHRKGEME